VTREPELDSMVTKYVLVCSVVAFVIAFAIVAFKQDEPKPEPQTCVCVCQETP
jgi:hypothetical protein